MKDIIDELNARRDIRILNNKWAEWIDEWQSEDLNPSAQANIAQMELILAVTIATKYKGFIFDYDPTDYENTRCDEWWEDQVFTEEQFENLIVTENNYGKADAVATDIKEELLLYIEAELGD